MSSLAHIAYLSLGSNLGDRSGQLSTAITALSTRHCKLRHRSANYETEPVDYPDQPPFLNCVVEIETSLAPLELLRQVQEIEAACGRVRDVPAARPKGPRTLDIDILLYGNLVLRSDALTIPHPAMCERRFVLQPLADLAPDLIIPGTDLTVAAALALLPDKPAVRRCAGP